MHMWVMVEVALSQSLVRTLSYKYTLTSTRHGKKKVMKDKDETWRLRSLLGCRTYRRAEIGSDYGHVEAMLTDSSWPDEVGLRQTEDWMQET